MNLNVINGTQTQGLLHYVLQGQSTGGDDGGGSSIGITSSQITLGNASGQTLYTGSLSNLTSGEVLQMTAQLNGSGATPQNLNVQIILRIHNDQRVTGTIAGSARYYR